MRRLNSKLVSPWEDEEVFEEAMGVKNQPKKKPPTDHTSG